MIYQESQYSKGYVFINLTVFMILVKFKGIGFWRKEFYWDSVIYQNTHGFLELAQPGFELNI